MPGSVGLGAKRKGKNNKCEVCLYNLAECRCEENEEKAVLEESAERAGVAQPKTIKRMWP